MVELLTMTGTHQKKYAPPVAIIAASWLIAVCGFATETSITLSRGANISVTAPAISDQIAFDLAGKIWLMDGTDEPARSLTESGALHQRPAFSRDGRLVAYESVQSGYRQIFIADVQSGDSRQVTFGPFDHCAPTWSTADSSQLAMSSNRGGNFDIWEVDVNDLNLRQLTFAADDEFDPAWNDDGSRLAYVAKSKQGSSLYILKPGENPQRVLQEREAIAAPTWRPGGGLLAYVRQGGQSSQLRMLILSTPPITKPITRHEQVSPRAVHWIDRAEFLYAADGKIRRRTLGLSTFSDIPFSVTIEIDRDERAALTASVAGHDNQPVRGLNGSTERADGRYIVAALSDLWEFQHQDNNELLLARQLTNDAYVDAQPSFSPAGERLAFVSDRSGNPQIWVMELSSLDMQRLTRDMDVVGHPGWNPDGNKVVFLVTDDELGYRLHQVDLSSHQVQPLAATSHYPGRPVLIDGTWAIHNEPNAQFDALNRLDQQSVPLTWRPATSSERYIVRAGRIFDGIGPDYILHHEIVIERGLIVAIRPWSEDEMNTPTIDATTHTVIPGLIDLTVQQTSVNEERTGRRWLADGVTTIRQTVTDFSLTMEQLESWNSGRRVGPRLKLTARPCNPETDHFDELLFEQIIAQATVLNIVAIEQCTDLTGTALANIFERAHEQGLSVITTTLEAPLTSQGLGLGLHTELRQLAASGVQPFQALKMASLDAARILGNGESLGMVRVGRQADLVIIDGDPLTDITAVTHVVGTIVNGRYYSRKDLTTRGLRGQTRIPK